MDITSYLLGKQAGGGSTPSLQSKSVTITENGTQNVTADSGYDGLSNVSVTTNVSGGGGSSLDWSAIGYSGEPESIEEDYNYAKNIYDNWDATRTSYANLYYNDLNLVFFPLVNTSAGTSFKSMFSGCVSLQTVPLINTSSGVVFSTMFQSCRRLTEIPQLDTSNGINLSSMFASCTKLKKIPVLNFSKATNISGMFSGCSLLTDESLDNILQSCVNINPSYQNTKTLGVLGFTSTYYPVSRIQTLPHYQDFLDAGWTIGY